MDIKRLRYFCTIVEQGQISRAAKVLNMSQPPLSQRLKELEAELNTPLIVREGGEWEVTEAGSMLYNDAKKIIEQLDGIEERIRDSVDGFGGQITMGVSPACLSYIASAVPVIHREYPQLRFRVKVTDSNFLEKDLTAKCLDLAAVLLPLEGDAHNVRLLPKDNFSVLFGCNTPTPNNRQGLSLRDLAGFPLILSRRWWGWGGYETLMSLMQEQGLHPKVILDSHNTQALVRIMEAGLPGAMLIPSREVTPHMHTQFTVKTLEESTMEIQPALIHPRGKFVSKAIAAASDIILREAWKSSPQGLIGE